MDIIKKLRKYFIGLRAISIGLTLLMMALYTADFYCSWLNINWLYTDLINTIIASFYAVTIAVWIYWNQQHDEYQNIRSTLISYLDGSSKQ